MAHLHCFAILLAVFFIGNIRAGFVPDEDGLISLARQPRASTLIITTTTVTASTPLTTTLVTKSYCANSTSLTSCRRKRQYWDAPRFFALGEHADDFYANQFPVKPSQVLRIEPSVVPEYRARPQYSSGFRAPPSYYPVDASFEKIPANVRVANPWFGAYKYTALVSLFSNLVSSLLTSTSTSTATITTFTSTVTSTSFSATVTYGLAGCLPSGVSLCPSSG